MVIIYGTLCRFYVGNMGGQPPIKQFSKGHTVAGKGAMVMLLNVICLKNFRLSLIGKVRNSLPLPVWPGDYINVRPPPVTG